MGLEGLGNYVFNNLCIFPYSRIIHLRALCLSVDICTLLQYVRVRLGGYISEGQGLCVENPPASTARLVGLLRLKRGDGETGLDGSELR